jgi:hypothetical protein
MANISFFFPKAKKGLATGLNAGLGNLGVSLVQFVTPLVIASAVFGSLAGDGGTYPADGAERGIWLQNAGFIWVPFIVVASLAAWFGMNDIADAKASFAEQAVIFRRKHNWLMCWLYVGTFGSFIGFSAGFALLTKSQFPAVDPTAYAFLGPLAGAVTRPVGGWISDKLGGARVTLYTFVAMTAAVFAVIHVPHDSRDLHDRAPAQGPGRRQRRTAPGAAGSRQGVRGGARVRRRRRRVWRLLHSANVRHRDRHDRLGGSRTVCVCRLLRELRRDDVVLLCAPQRRHALLIRTELHPRT